MEPVTCVDVVLRQGFREALRVPPMSPRSTRGLDARLRQPLAGHVQGGLVVVGAHHQQRVLLEVLAAQRALHHVVDVDQPASSPQPMSATKRGWSARGSLLNTSCRIASESEK